MLLPIAVFLLAGIMLAGYFKLQRAGMRLVVGAYCFNSQLHTFGFNNTTQVGNIGSVGLEVRSKRLGINTMIDIADPVGSGRHASPLSHGYGNPIECGILR